MKSSFRKAVMMSSLLLPSLVFAEIPVKEAMPVDGAAASVNVGADASNSQMLGSNESSGPSQEESVIAELYYQLQTLQEEVQNLRGMVESQNHELKQLKQERLDGYLNLDRRMSELSNRLSAPSFSSRTERRAVESRRPAVSNNASDLGGSNVNAGTSGALPNYEKTIGVDPGNADLVGTEKAQYKKARGLLKAKDYEGAIKAFNLIVSDFPDGLYAPNAYYWLGEIYLVIQDADKAKNAFLTLLEKFPTGRKVPDALYKLGVLYSKEDNQTLSQQFFNKLVKEYSSSSAARLASTYLESQ